MPWCSWRCAGAVAPRCCLECRRMTTDSHRVAVIDIGSNSTRLLIADVEAGRVSEVERQSCVTRLGRGVDLSGQLSAEAIEAACEAIGGYVALYEEAQVGEVVAIATSA